MRSTPADTRDDLRRRRHLEAWPEWWRWEIELTSRAPGIVSIDAGAS